MPGSPARLTHEVRTDLGSSDLGSSNAAPDAAKLSNKLNICGRVL